MTLILQNFHDKRLTEENLLVRLAWLRDAVAPRLERFLGYYRNPASELAASLPCAPGAQFAVRPFRHYQEFGLPARITGFRRAADGSSIACGPVDMQRKDVVIENDIAWRVDTLVDFAASRAPAIVSTAADPARQAMLTPIILGILATASGDAPRHCGDVLRLLQSLVLQSAIAGSAWVHLRPAPALIERLHHTGEIAPSTDACEMSRWFTLEVLEARRVCPIVLEPGAAPSYIAMLRDNGALKKQTPSGILQRFRIWLGSAADLTPQAEEFSFDLFGSDWWQSYDSGNLRLEDLNPLGILPFIRHENAPDPAAGTRVGAVGSGAVDAGIGDVEPLIALQDELNTRLSDRAFRVTMSSFRMFLGKGIEDFIKRPIGPGQMWQTDNMDAEIESFGGDERAPSEELHINDIRDALDKTSGVSPVAAGIIRGKLGNLTSAVALRVTLIALLARTERKRAALSRTLGTIVRTALEILDHAGIVKTAPNERGIDVNWPTAIPESDMDRLTEAQAKLLLGIPREVILKELGYSELVEPAPAKAAAQEIPQLEPLTTIHETATAA